MREAISARKPGEDSVKGWIDANMYGKQKITEALLEACRGFLNEDCESYCGLNKDDAHTCYPTMARKAIAKAEGRTP